MAQKNLTDDERRAIYQHLLAKSVNCKLPRGSITNAANRWNKSRYTIHRIWKRGQESRNSSNSPGNVDSHIKSKSGRKANDVSVIQSKVSKLSLIERKTLRSMASASGIPKSTLHRARKNGALLRHSSSTKPKLTDAHKMKRMQFALSFVRYSRHSSQYEFHNMFDTVHIDEKWFNMYRDKENFYLTPNESAPHRTTQSKKFIGKVMFLCALARPRYDHHRKTSFDGKIGIWPFVREEAAVRNSRHRPAGTLEMKPIKVTKEVYSAALVEKVFPAIRTKFPFQKHVKVRLQQDNARPHISPDDGYALQSTSSGSVKIELVCQPPNSPDMNVLDLGFFNSIQSMQLRTYSNSVRQLVDNVNRAYENYPSSKVTDVFITYQSVLEDTLRVNGDNNFKLRHGLKSGMNADQKSAFNLSCNESVYKLALDYVKNHASAP